MIQLYDKESGQTIGAISEEQLKFLIDQLEEESSEDKDYYLNRDTLDFIEQAGADPGLLTLLRTAMGNREEMEIRWSRS